jgi:hypothetical protein
MEVAMRNLFLALALLLLAAPADAQQGGRGLGPDITAPSGDVASLFKQFGLTGNWSINCADRRPNTWEIRFIEQGGKVFQVHSNGRNENRYEILEATQLAPDRLRVRVRFTNIENDDLQTHEWVVRDGRSRTYSNISDKRGPIVADGIVITAKRETPWIERCAGS